MKLSIVGLVAALAVAAAVIFVALGGHPRGVSLAEAPAHTAAIAEVRAPALPLVQPEPPRPMQEPVAPAPRTYPAVAAPAPRPTAAPADTNSVLVDGRWRARYWSPGKPAAHSPVEKEPGYKKLDDPEAETTITGRRKVGPTAAQFRDGATSASQLAMVLLDCINRDDYMGLRAVQISFDEFRDILWPEFPQSRPATHVKAEDAWEVLLHSSVTGARRALGEWAGQDLTFEGLSFEKGWTPYANFNLYLGVRIHARTRAGEVVEIKYADGFVERNGQWKVYIYND
jgi:hypothetical protein